MPPTTRRRKRAQEQYALIEKYLASGLTQKMFCQQHGLALSTFHLWLKNYRQANDVGTPEAPQSSESFIPLVFNSPQSAGTVPQIVIEYPNGVVVRICQAVPTQVLSQLIQSFGG